MGLGLGLVCSAHKKTECASACSRCRKLTPPRAVLASTSAGAGDGTAAEEEGEEAAAAEQIASCWHRCLQGVQTSSWSLHTLHTTSGSTSCQASPQ